MNRWKKTAALSVLALMVTAAPTWAANPPEIKPILVAALQQPVTLLEVQANHALPTSVTVNGTAVAFDQTPVVMDGVLMVPLRFVVEAAGGTVGWDGAEQAVTVDLPDRTAMFMIGQGEAEMNQRGVFYIKRNMIKMARPAVVVADRTMISADALSTILGLQELPESGDAMNLVNPVQASGPATGGLGVKVDAQSVDAASAPEELRSWKGSAERASKTVVTESGTYLAIGAGECPTAGYRIEIVRAMRQPNGTWLVDVRVSPPEGMAAQVISYPVGYFFLPGVKDPVELRFNQL
jgi:hypothetical protein